MTKVIAIRTELHPGDLGSIVAMHGRVYARECGCDTTFEAYVAAPLGELAQKRSKRDRIWVAETGAGIVGSIAIVSASPAESQLRWFLVDPEARGQALGTTLLREAVAFSRAAGFSSIHLWTVGSLQAAARLYEAAGFRMLEQKPGRRWGVEVVEQRYGLELRAS